MSHDAEMLLCRLATKIALIEPGHEKTCLRRFGPVKTQIGGARWLSGRVSDMEREVGGSKPTAAVLCP